MKQQTPKQNRPPMPIEKLLANKEKVRAKCSIQEKKLYDDFEYIRNNTSHILLSGLSSLLFSPGERAKKKPETQSIAPVNDHQTLQNGSLFSVSNLRIVANTIAPVVWNIVRPVLIKWGVNKAKSLLIGLFTKKKVATTAKTAK